eukprot:15443431-Alexandrium_andersonii.AAC.1
MGQAADQGCAQKRPAFARLTAERARGVGDGSQRRVRDCALPVAIANGEGELATGAYETPVAP